jgi:serine/threonine protein kinase
MANMHSSPFVTGVREGDLLAGKYRVDKVLGAGGMGVVVAAHHVQLDERVAIKFLLPEALGNAEAVARFAREARAAVKIKSEHVARVIDVGTLETGAPYIVMEYLDGGDLEKWVEQRGPLPIEQAVEFILQALEAVAEAHALGIVHRDLKPANLFCIRQADGLLSVKVLDFGISKVTGMSASGPMGMTKTTAVMGSPLYMSPEQLESARNVDARTDIWAIGAILYELVTGRVPFVADSLPELVVKILSGVPEPLAKLRPDAPPGLERVILKCLEKKRTNRYEHLGELAVALLEFGPRRARASVERISGVIQTSGLSASAMEMPPPSSDSGAPQGRTLDSWGQTTGGPAGDKKVVLGIVVGLALAAALGLAFFFVKREPQPPPTSSMLAPAAALPPLAQPQPALSPSPAASAPEQAGVAIAAPASSPSITPSASAAREEPAASSAKRTRVLLKPAFAVSTTAAPKPGPQAPPQTAPVSTQPKGTVYDDRK